MESIDQRSVGIPSHPPSPSNPFIPFLKSEIDQTLHSRFEGQVRSHPERPATVTRTGRVTYRELNAHANRVARAILGCCGAEPEPVPLFFHQGIPSIIAILGTLKAGKFYVPVEPTLPPEIASTVLRNSRPRIVVTDSSNGTVARGFCGKRTYLLEIDRIGKDFSDQNPGLPGSPDALAYVYYTSGTTGVPKGVMDTHRNVLQNILRYTNRLHVCAQDRLTLLQPFGFSGAVSSLFCALLNGACVFPVDFRNETPNAIAQWLDEAGITIYHSVPAVFRALLTNGRILRNVRVVRLEGDQASVADVELFRKCFGPDSLLVNGLGTTETGIACQFFMNKAMASTCSIVPVGYASEGVEILLLDEDGTPLAETGRPGEIGVASPYLSPGYWQNPELTRRAFIPDPRGKPGRIYKTGDLGRLRQDGCLEYLGRLDSHRKVRGQWVALADVESALLRMEGVREAVVDVQEDGTGDFRLVAYVVPEGKHLLTATAIRKSLADSLSPHMVPSRYVRMEAFPLTPNGKLDRRSLPPPRGRPELGNDYVAEQTLLQRRILQVWEEVLDVRPIGIRDNFFDLGGHSLLAARMVDRLVEVLDRDIPLSILFQAPNVEAMADILFQRDRDLFFPLVHVQSGGSRLPFYFLHGDYLSGGFYCLELSRHVGTDQPFYAMPPCGLDGQPVPASYEEMAAIHLETLRTFQPVGPYRLGGTCNGGLVAFEMARRLVECGQKVDRLVLIGSSAGNVRFSRMKEKVEAVGATLGLSLDARMFLYKRMREMAINLYHLPLHHRIVRLIGKSWKIPGDMFKLFRAHAPAGPGKTGPSVAVQEGGTLRERRERIRERYQWIDQLYIPRKCSLPVTLFWAENDPEPPEEAARYWGEISPRVDLHVIPGTHIGSLTEDVRILGDHLKRCLD